ncbi:archaeosortase A [Halobacteriales archaeon Cl-PHB]
MFGALIDLLAAVGAFTDQLGWLVVVLFVAGVVLEQFDRESARYVLAGAWILFGAFWLTLIYHFVFEQKSIIESLGSLLAVPLSVYVGHLLVRGRDSLFVLSRAIAVMGAVYLPFVAMPQLAKPLIEMTTAHTAWAMDLIGFNPDVVGGTTIDATVDGTTRTYDIAKKTHPFESTFVFPGQSEIPITYTIVLACTGIGSMAIMAGLIAAVDAPLARKSKAFLVAIPVIYVLNLVRNVFIGLGFGHQYFQILPDLTTALFGLESSFMVSYIWADRIIAQSASVLALVAITYLIVQELPEVLTILEDGIYLVTGQEYDLATAFGVERPSESAAD